MLNLNVGGAGDIQLTGSTKTLNIAAAGRSGLAVRSRGHRTLDPGHGGGPAARRPALPGRPPAVRARGTAGSVSVRRARRLG